MRWQNREASENVEDRRGRRSGFGGRRVGGASGIVALLVVLVAGYYGIDLSPLLSDGAGITSPSSSAPYEPTPEEEEMARFTSVALKTTEETWESIFQRLGRSYPPPKLVLYSGVTDTACGYGESAMGPFYCPGDQSVYIDLAFYRDMKRRLGGGGDFAQGYVIAHEVGHHIQHLMGIQEEVDKLRQSASRAQANQLSVRLELQADCFAGVWGKAMQDQGLLDQGDLEEALNTAQAIGDDRLQKQSSGRVVPDSFTHGSSAQRLYWFKRGFETGDPNQCNTFEEMK